MFWHHLCHHFLFHLGCGCLACCSYVWGVFSSDLLLPSFMPLKKKKKRTTNSCCITDVNRGLLRGEISTWDLWLLILMFGDIHWKKPWKLRLLRWSCFGLCKKQNCWTDLHENLTSCGSSPLSLLRCYFLLMYKKWSWMCSVVSRAGRVRAAVTSKRSFCILLVWFFFRFTILASIWLLLSNYR